MTNTNAIFMVEVQQTFADGGTRERVYNVSATAPERAERIARRQYMRDWAVEPSRGDEVTATCIG